MDDNPENNFGLAQQFESKGIQTLFSTSTNDAISLFERYNWILSLSKPKFRIISDMVRKEDDEMNYLAGVDLLNRLFNDH